MIKLKRRKTTSNIPSSLAGSKLVDKNRELLDRVIAGSKIRKKWGPAKINLRRESNKKCAYCEADTAIVAHGDVEHFRPKSVYWWLAYCYDNYAYSCQICNQTYKSNQFNTLGPALTMPISANMSAAQKNALAKKLCPDPLDGPLDGQSAYSFSQYKSDCLGEKATLIDPYLQNPKTYLSYKVVEEGGLKGVKIQVRGNSERRKAMNRDLDDCLGLNRRELLDERWNTYRLIKLFRDVLSSPTTEEEIKQGTLEALQAMAAPNYRFSGMTLFFLDQWNIDLT